MLVLKQEMKSLSYRINTHSAEVQRLTQTALYPELPVTLFLT